MVKNYNGESYIIPNKFVEEVVREYWIDGYITYRIAEEIYGDLEN